MVFNFRFREISRSTRKLTRTPMLIKKNHFPSVIFSVAISEFILDGSTGL